MPNAITHNFGSLSLTLLADRAVWWEDARTLVIADPHIGKAGHFQRYGISLPAAVEDNDLQRLSQLVQEYVPTRLVVLGDLFHSVRNAGWDAWFEWRAAHPDLAVTLVRGNHDRFIQDERLMAADIEVTAQFEAPGLLGVHDATGGDYSSDIVVLSGHIHPVTVLRAKGDRLKLPCFVADGKSLLLPAFGSFTGGQVVRQAGKRIYAIDNLSVYLIDRTQ